MDRSANMGGNIDSYTNLEVSTGNHTCILQFYVMNMEGDCLVLSYPWFTAANLKPDWSKGMLPVNIEVQTAGAARARPMSLLTPTPLISQDGPSIPITDA